MASGFATHATSARHLRPSRLPISARVALSGSESRSRAGSCERRIRFSAATYSHCRSRRWLTNPVIYANSRAHLLSCIMNEHHTGLAWHGSDGYFDRTGTGAVRTSPRSYSTHGILSVREQAIAALLSDAEMNEILRRATRDRIPA